MHFARWILSFAFASLASFAAAETPSRVSVEVDTRIELLSIVARLAGFDEYCMPNSDSPYAKEVAAWFAPMREHEAVRLARKLRETSGISFDAVPSLAVHLVDVATLAEKLPFDGPPPRLDARWKLGEARAFVAALRSFVAESKAEEFFAAHRELYAETAKRLGAVLDKSRAVEWFDSFFGVRAGAKYTAIPGLLCGGCNYGVGVRATDGRPEEITPVFGCSRFDEHGVPEFGDSMLSLFVHELCHSYTNVLVDRHVERFATSGPAIYARVAKRMASQGYGDWKSMIYESLVRACAFECLAATLGANEAEVERRDDESRGFSWIGDLAGLLERYQKLRKTYTDFDSFMPVVVEFFDRLPAQLEARAAATPKVVEVAPAAGSKDVDPTITELVVRFDRPMSSSSWSFVGAKADTPEFVGDPVFDADGMRLVAKMRLAPGRKYDFSLNGGRFLGFKSRTGLALEPYPIEFATRE